MVTIGTPLDFKYSTNSLSHWSNAIEGKAMVESLKELMSVYKPLIKERRIELNWGKKTQ